jgi:hypothetical protein
MDLNGPASSAPVQAAWVRHRWFGRASPRRQIRPGSCRIDALGQVTHHGYSRLSALATSTPQVSLARPATAGVTTSTAGGLCPSCEEPVAVTADGDK